MAGTRASYPITPEALATLGAGRFREAFLIGDREDPVRYRGINVACGLYEAAGIYHRYAEYPGGHTIPPSELMREMIGYVAGVDLPPVVDRIAVRIPVPLEASRDGVSLLEERAVPTGIRSRSPQLTSFSATPPRSHLSVPRHNRFVNTPYLSVSHACVVQ